MHATMLSAKRANVRILAASGVLVWAILLSGCLDMVQYISGDAANIEVYFRVALQKSVFALASSFGDAPQDLDQMFEAEFNLNEEDVVAELPPGILVDFKPLNNDFEFGFELRYSAPRAVLGSLPDAEAAFVPRVSPQGIWIPLGQANDSSESDEFAEAFLGGTKYRLMISKRLVSRIQGARVLAGPESVPVSVTNLPDVWLIEFPISLWYGSEYSPTLEILF